MADGYGWRLTGAMSHLRSAMCAIHAKLDASDAEAVAGREPRLVDPLVVHERAVRALEIEDLDGVVAGCEAAVDARDQCGIDNEVGARGAADGLDCPGRQAERQRVAIVRGALEDPHGRLS